MPAGINVLIDPFDLFGVSPLSQGPSLNQRFHHIRYLSDNPGKFNVLMMGTSITGIIDPRVVDAIVPGARTYNMGFFLATPSDLLKAAKYLHAHNVLPQRVIVGVDTFLFVARDPSLRHQFKFPPEVTDESAANWWLEATFSSSGSQAVNKIFDHFSSTPSVTFDLERGNYHLPRLYERRANDPAGHDKSSLAAMSVIAEEGDLVESEFQALVELEDFLDRVGVKSLWVVKPSSKVLRETYGLENYLRVKARVRAKLRGDVVDMTEFEGISDDPRQWYDMKHFTEDAGGRLISAALRASTTFGDSAKKVSGKP